MGLNPEMNACHEARFWQVAADDVQTFLMLHYTTQQGMDQNSPMKEADSRDTHLRMK